MQQIQDTFFLKSDVQKNHWTTRNLWKTQRLVSWVSYNHKAKPLMWKQGPGVSALPKKYRSVNWKSDIWSVCNRKQHKISFAGSSEARWRFLVSLRTKILVRFVGVLKNGSAGRRLIGPKFILQQDDPGTALMQDHWQHGGLVERPGFDPQIRPRVFLWGVCMFASCLIGLSPTV